MTQGNVQPFPQPENKEGRKRLATWGEVSPEEADKVLAELTEAQSEKV